MAKAPKSGMNCGEEMDDMESESGETEIEISVKGLEKKSKGGMINASGKGCGSAVKGRKFQGTY